MAVPVREPASGPAAAAVAIHGTGPPPDVHFTDDSPPSDDDRPDLARILADPSEPTLFFQPIVDLHSGDIAGYEALARFRSHPTCPPDRVFAAADQVGCAAELEARVLAAALAARDRLPDRCFLAVNVLPHLLNTVEVSAVWRGADLRRLVVELNEAVDLDTAGGITTTASALRDLGAFVAMDDVGSGYAGLRQLARIRPDFVKLDRSLVVNVDDDQVKIALTELVGSFASRLNAWLIAEGIERNDELAMLVGLGVPLGQGFLLGRPSPHWQQLDPAVARRIRQLSERTNRAASIESLMEQARISAGDSGRCDVSPACPSCSRGSDGTPDEPSADDDQPEGSDGDQAPRATIIVSNRCRPVALHLPGGPAGSTEPRRVPTTLFARPEESVTEVARRAMTRSRASRFDPVIIVTEMGRPLGLVRMERLMLRLAEMST